MAALPISELKKLQKRIKKDYQLALDLYATANYDAMYLAGLIADDARMTQRDLQRWVDQAYAGALCVDPIPFNADGSVRVFPPSTGRASATEKFP